MELHQWDVEEVELTHNSTLAEYMGNFSSDDQSPHIHNKHQKIYDIPQNESFHMLHKQV